MAQTAATTAQKKTPTADWRYIFLTDLGAPVTKTNLAFLDLWARFEGGMSHNNPLNTSLRTSHSTGTWNSSGVQNYDSMANGAHAAAQTLLNTPAKNYPLIVSLFRKGGTLPQLAAAVELSPWDAKHYGGINSKGVYVGGSLLNAVLPKAGQKPGLGNLIGEIGHYTIHPGAGVDKTAGAAKTAVEGPVLDTLHYILYGLAIAGGGMLVITGIILIAADIGLSKRGPRDYGGAALGTLRRSPSESSAGDEYDEAGREHAEFLRAESKRQRRHPVTEGEVDKPVKSVKPKVDVSRRLRKVA